MTLESRLLRVLVTAGLLLSVGCAATQTPKPETPPLPTTAQAGGATVVVAPPTQPCCPHLTLPEFLGLNCLFDKLGKGITWIRSVLGSRFPALEPRPPVLPLTDPANSAANAPPACQAAAGVKAEEDAAPQKIKALRYLASIGCGGCYPDVEDAFLAALDDCTEVVRYEAVVALRMTASHRCQLCRSTACCSTKIRKRLHQLACDTDDKCCPKETSARVRRLARLTLLNCGQPETSEPARPTEGPAEEPAEEAAPPGEQKPPPEKPGGAVADGAPVASLDQALAALRTGDRHGAPAGGPAAPGNADRVVARVNGEPIFASEIDRRVAQRLAHESQAAASGSRAARREALAHDEVERAIERKLLCQDARRVLPPYEFANVAYRAPVPSEFRPMVTRQPNPASPDEEALAAEWISRQMRIPDTCSRQELFSYYRANYARYQEPWQVRWEQVTARADRFPDHERAVAALEALRCTLRGVPCPPQPQASLNALEIQTRDWTRSEDLVPGVITQTLGVLPIGEVSAILQDNSGLHLVRVLDRREPRLKTLDEVADQVRRDLVQARYDEARRAYVQGLRAQADIWTAWDPGASERPPATTVVLPAPTVAPPPQNCPCGR